LSGFTQTNQHKRLPNKANGFGYEEITLGRQTLSQAHPPDDRMQTSSEDLFQETISITLHRDP
jgi:hypothetical protein